MHLNIRLNFRLIIAFILAIIGSFAASPENTFFGPQHEAQAFEGTELTMSARK